MKDTILVFDCSAIPEGIVIDCVQHNVQNERSLAREEVRFSSEQSQHLLSGVQQVCARAHVALRDLLGIALVYGGERFTVARLGAVVANALAWSNHIPICGFSTRVPALHMATALAQQTPGTPLQPRYSKEPNITV